MAEAADTGDTSGAGGDAHSSAEGLLSAKLGEVRIESQPTRMEGVGQLLGDAMEADDHETPPSGEGSGRLPPRHPQQLLNPLYKDLSTTGLTKTQLKNIKARIRRKEHSKTKEGQGVNCERRSSYFHLCPAW